MKSKLVVCIFICIVCSVLQGFAAGYALFQGSARGNANAANFIAGNEEDPGTIYFNPAAITALPGTQIQAGLSLVMPQASVETINPYTGVWAKTDGKEKVWPIPSAYVTHQLNDSIWLGLGMFSRFGLGAELDDTWPGRYNSYKAMIESFDIVPTVAWKVNKKLSVSAGLIIRYFDIELAQKIDVAGAAGLRDYNDPSPSPYDVDQNLHGDDINAGIALSVQFNPIETVSLGAAYHSRIRFVCKGDADWTKPAAVDAMLPNTLNDTTWRAKNYNPDEFMVGASWDVTKQFTLAGSIVYSLWSVYDDLIVDLDEPMLMGREQLSSTKNWKDVWRLTLGGNYALNDNWTVRASYTFDESPLNTEYVDYLVPGDDRHLFGFGLTWDKDTWTCDLGYFYEIVKSMSVSGRPQNGVFDGRFSDASAHCVSFSVAKRF